MSALLGRAENLKIPIEACTRNELICIIGAAGGGKSTLAAALVSSKTLVDLTHIFKETDNRRQDRSLVIRSLAY
jgi:ABC-type cobalamin/Fe3+-siderophores transport system ATPase subunit